MTADPGEQHRPADPLDAPVDSPWQSFTARLPVVRGRLVGAGAGLVGVLLAVPLVFLPTHSISQVQDVSGANAAETTHFQQSLWSWGRVAETTPNIDPQFDFSNYPALLYFLLVLVLAAAACLLYAFRPGAEGRILGAVGVTWLAAQVVGDLVRRVGETMSGFYGQNNIQVDTRLGGILQIGSALALVVAVVAIAWQPLVGLARSAWLWSVGVLRRASERARHDEPEQTAPPPRVGIATIRDARPAHDQPAWHTTEGVGFSDDAGSDPDRFRPPR